MSATERPTSDVPNKLNTPTKLAPVISFGSSAGFSSSERLEVGVAGSEPGVIAEETSAMACEETSAQDDIQADDIHAEVPKAK